MENLYENYTPNSNGYWNENYGSYQNYGSHGSYLSPANTSSSSSNTWNAPSQQTSLSSPVEGLNLLNLIETCHSQAVVEKSLGIKPDYTECPWLKNPEGKRGRPAEYSSEEEKKWAKWRNNWIYNEKQEMGKSIQKAERIMVQKTNQELKDEYFQLCLEAIVLSENLCPHNRSTVTAAMENPKIQKQICGCNQNNSNNGWL